jgi:acetyl esterase/lipase
MIHRRAFVASLAALSLAPAHAQPRAPRTYRYAETPGVDPDLQSLDLYPAASGPRPLVAFIHGGGWRIGDKANAPHGPQKAAFFNAQGFAYASINYRLSPAVTHPAHVEDVAAAVAWLAKNARSHGIDARSITVMGHSAGAHLAALVATDARRLGAHNLPLSAIRGAILLDGAGYDVMRQAPTVIARGGFLGEMYADAFGRDGALWSDASPVAHVRAGAGIAPFLIVHTDRPDAVSQSTLLADRLRGAGVDAQLFRAAGYSHADANRKVGQAGEPVTEAIMAALRRWQG